MAIDADLVAYLKAEPAVYALTADRIAANERRHTDNPRDQAIVYRRAATEATFTTTGVTGPSTVQYELECHGSTKDDARAVADAAKAALNRDRFAMGGSRVWRAMCQDDSDQIVVDPQGAPTGQNAVSLSATLLLVGFVK